jgi:hypothetical protein
MGVIGRLSLAFWIAATGTVVLYAFFVFLARIPPEQVAGVTAVVALLAAITTLRNMRVAGQMAGRGGNPQLRRARNRMRERRGF